MRSRNLCFVYILWAVLWAGCEQQPKNANKEGFLKTDAPVNNKTAKEDPVSRIQLSALNGEEISLKQFSGKTIFLNFWATWCKPCLKEMPSIENARKQLSGKDFVFLAASDEDPEKIKEFKDRHDYTFQLVHLRQNFPDIDIYSLPTTLVIDSNGKIVMEKAGALEWDSPQMIRQLREIAGSSH